MCGRFGLWADKGRVQDYFQLQEPLPLEQRYNIAPGQEVLAVGEDRDRLRKAARLHWGLVPHWADEPKTGYRMINARAETMWQKPAYRAAAKRRRCLVPASCFFEWKRRQKGGKAPYCIRPKTGDIFAFAAIWEHWEDEESGRTMDSCAIVTTRANEAIAALHDRMPAIIPRSGFGAWLDRSREGPDDLQELLQPSPSESLEIYPVGREVNNPKNDRRSVVEPVEGSAGTG